MNSWQILGNKTKPEPAMVDDFLVAMEERACDFMWPIRWNSASGQ
jgi:hypothetical protein